MGENIERHGFGCDQENKGAGGIKYMENTNYLNGFENACILIRNISGDKDLGKEIQNLFTVYATEKD